jgi:hypothetical protein
LKVYRLPPRPGGRGLDVVTEKAAFIVIEKLPVAVSGVGALVSVAFNVKLAVPAVVGVPEIVLPERVSPCGSEPDEIDHV